MIWIVVARFVVALWLALAMSAASRADAFSSIDYRRGTGGRSSYKRTCQCFAWFGVGGGGSSSGAGANGASSYSTLASGGGEDGGGLASGNKSLGGVAGTMMAMDKFKASQRLAKSTDALVQDLAGTTVDGFSGNGKVKVVYDCRQQPMEGSIDPTFFKEASASTVSAAFVEAMKDANFKSSETMNEKMKGFYNELGLS
jgi:DNA-binding protein YbaB